MNKSQNLKLEGGFKGAIAKNTKQNNIATNINKIGTIQLFGLTQETKFDTFVTNVGKMQMTLSNFCKEFFLEETYLKNLWKSFRNDSYLKAL